MAALSDAAAVLFEHLPATYGTDRDDVDPVVARWLEALAFELGRAGALLEALRSTTIPTSADDTVGSLRRWEDAVGIPRAPDDVSIGQRRATLGATACIEGNLHYGAIEMSAGARINGKLVKL